ncbi:MAG: hypothetical protein JO100_02965 [Pseudonocardia sp.]|nr:hypothetical protein [Pseudonocardia sp.]
MSELDLRDLTVHSIEVVQSADYGHGMGELSASCIPGECNVPGGSHFLPEDWDWADA